MLWEQTGKAHCKNIKYQNCSETPCDEVCYDGEKKSILIQPRSLDGFTAQISLSFNVVRGSKRRGKNNGGVSFPTFHLLRCFTHWGRHLSKVGLFIVLKDWTQVTKTHTFCVSPYLIREALQKNVAIAGIFWSTSTTLSQTSNRNWFDFYTALNAFSSIWYFMDFFLQ